MRRERHSHTVHLMAGRTDKWEVETYCYPTRATVRIGAGGTEFTFFLELDNSVDGSTHKGGWSLADAHLESLENAIRAERKAIENGER